MILNKYLVWGNPASHSLSPRVHALFAAQRGTTIDYRTRGDGMSEAQFICAFKKFFAIEGGKGCNVTSPFKRIVFDMIENRSEICQIAQACNTVIYQEDGTLLAENTDGYGLSTDLDDLGWLDINTKVLILGAGGAVTGVLFKLLQEGVVVDIFNRTYDKAQDVVKRFAKFGQVHAVTEYDIDDYDLVINAVAYHAQNNDKVNLNNNVIKNQYTKFYDMQYVKTGYTPFLQYVLNIGANPMNVSDGLGMLVKQAALSYFYWFNIMPDANLALEQLRAELTASK